MTTTQQEFDALVKGIEPKRPLLKNCIRAFLSGGAICTIGQILQWIFINYFGFDENGFSTWDFDMCREVFLCCGA